MLSINSALAPPLHQYALHPALGCFYVCPLSLPIGAQAKQFQASLRGNW